MEDTECCNPTPNQNRSAYSVELYWFHAIQIFTALCFCCKVNKYLMQSMSYSLLLYNIIFIYQNRPVFLFKNPFNSCYALLIVSSPALRWEWEELSECVWKVLPGVWSIEGSWKAAFVLAVKMHSGEFKRGFSFWENYGLMKHCNWHTSTSNHSLIPVHMVELWHKLLY